MEIEIPIHPISHHIEQCTATKNKHSGGVSCNACSAFIVFLILILQTHPANKLSKISLNN